MRLIIAEKPEVAEAILLALGGKPQARDKRFFEVNSNKITWCYGHLVELYDPEDYETTEEGKKAAKRWTWATLPVYIYPYKKRVIDRKNSKEQYAAIAKLLKQADEVIHAGDPDEEGQLLVDEILLRENYRGKVNRVLINDLNKELVVKAFDKLEPNAKYEPMGRAAEARSVSDKYYGYTMTRAFTLQARENGYDGTFNVGRVKTAVMGLVVRNNRAFEKHVKQEYYEIEGVADCGDIKLRAKYKPLESDTISDDKRLIDKNEAEGIKDQIGQGECKLKSSKTTPKKIAPPLPYSLINLQIDAANKFGYSSDDVLAITQGLREQHKLITYNRSDCSYLSEEQHADGLSVMKAILATVPDLASAVKCADVKIKGKAFDSSKVTAHHAIIPTMATADLAKLSEKERNIYILIAQRYILQFYPDYAYEQTTYVFESNQRLLYATVNIPKNQGWKAATKGEGGDDETEEIEIAAKPKIKDGDKINLATVELLTKYTKPRPIYTEATLLKDLTQAAKYCKDERLRKLLLEKDEEKEGEKGGIGTPATRSAILQKMSEDDGLLRRDGKKIIATESARLLYDSLPDFAVYPDLTALWFEDQKAVIDGQMSIEAFIVKQVQRAKAEIDNLKKDGMNVKPNMPVCPTCKQGFLMSGKGQYGTYWRCMNAQCNKSYKDQGGKPVLDSKPKEEGGACPICGEGTLIEINSKNGLIWLCKNDQCKAIFEDYKNKPAIQMYDCPTCKGEKTLKMSKGKYGLYFRCTNNGCTTAYPEKDGKPDTAPKVKKAPSGAYSCKTCGAGLIKYDKGDKPFWGCSNFRKTGCKTTYQCNDKGLPIYK